MFCIYYFVQEIVEDVVEEAVVQGIDGINNFYKLKLYNL